MNGIRSNLSEIDISVTPEVRALVSKWAADAYNNKIIKEQVDMGKLFQ